MGQAESLTGIIRTLEDTAPTVLRAMSNTPNGRLRPVVEAFVRHTHAFALEVSLIEVGVVARWLRPVVAALVLIVVRPSIAHALEEGKMHYPEGVNTAAPALLAPPPGDTVLLDYNQWYTASEDIGANGQPVVPGYHLNVYATATRFMHSWVDWNGFVIGTQIIPTYSVVDVNLGKGGTSDRGGFGDLNFAQYVQWSRGDWHFAAYANVWAPTGRYSRTDPASQGLNYWTFGPTGAVTWQPDHGRYEISAYAISLFNIENRATHYKSGNLLIIDYDFGVYPFRSLPKLQLAMVGYATTQWTNDTQFGQTVPVDGHRARAIAIGPQVLYLFGRYGVAIKWEHEIAVRNEPLGNRFWLKFKVSL